MYKNLLKNTSLLTLILGEKHGFNFIWKIILSFIWMSGSASHDRSLTIGSCVSMHSSRYEAHGKFGEHERCIWVAWGIAESNSSFLSALQTSLALHISMNAQLTHESIVLLHFQSNGKFFFSRDLFADVMSMHNGNMKHAHAIEFDRQIY